MRRPVRLQKVGGGWGGGDKRKQGCGRVWGKGCGYSVEDLRGGDGGGGTKVGKDGVRKGAGEGEGRRGGESRRNGLCLCGGGRLELWNVTTPRGMQMEKTSNRKGGRKGVEGGGRC